MAQRNRAHVVVVLSYTLSSGRESFQRQIFTISCNGLSRMSDSPLPDRPSLRNVGKIAS